VDVTDLGEERGHRVLRVVGKGHKIVLVPLPPAVPRAVDRAVDERETGPILLNRAGTRMDRMAAARFGCGGCKQSGCGSRGCIRTCCGPRS
jgi:hypothetical protein